MEKTSYAIGMNIGHNLLQSGAKNIDYEALARGIADVLKGNETDLQPQEAGQILNKYFAELEEAKSQELIADGKAFLEANASRKEVTTLKSGLQYEVLKAGDGPKPKATDTVRCHYHGTLIDGTVFDSSVRRGQPADFPVNGVIAGWVEALQLMPVGSKWKLYIPYDLGYGARGAGQSIPPYATLIFEVELLEIL
ncbi:MAG: FKBP-type peptidyl-prolyl cis-trans isomerase [Bacteroidales bacterium]|nr:FKBP-type peptidyl-prolyl cis-trans isomerase [Bacteroidales bacterium]MDD7724349.1 FKBP-type peptidyl-prolyl cis-trans isomerase [Bacteroidales bacterium]MDY4175461.1 FKBP-type peptidyl-prolyl cis-trans isomerase [Bacteroidales bacterium]